MPRDRHASRASFACVRCKKDKRRCDISQILNEGDGQDQSCTLCRNKNEKCEVRFGEDRRSNRPSNDPNALHKRMQALEEFVKNASRTDAAAFAPPRDHGSPDYPSNSDYRYSDSPRRSSGRHASFASPASLSTPGTHTFASVPPSEESGRWPGTPDNDPTPASFRSTSFSSQCLPDFQLDETTASFPLGLDEILKSESAAKCDQYLGCGSLFPYAEITPKSDASIGISSQEKSFPEPEPIVAHLLDLFWQYQASQLLVVDQALFLQHRKMWDDSGGKGDRSFYTPCLLYAILSLASMVSLDKGVVRYSASSGGFAGETFAKKARELLEGEMGHPAISTVQAAVVLGHRYGAMADNCLGWMYSGMAFRMATAIGLHLDCSKAVAASQMSPEMARFRCRVFWACRGEDTLVSSFNGRPAAFIKGEITAPLPDQPAHHVHSEGDEVAAAHLHASSTLAELQSEIMTKIYGRRHDNTIAELRRYSSQLHDELWQWHASLPAELKMPFDTRTTPPSVFILQANSWTSMTFHFTALLLNRPFFRFSPSSIGVHNLGPSSRNSATACTTAAGEITKLIGDYASRFNIRQVPPAVVHFIFLSGTIHLMNLHKTRTRSHGDLLQTCVEALDGIEESYPISGKASQSLRDLAERWKPSDFGRRPAYELSTDPEPGESPDDGGGHFSDSTTGLPPSQRFGGVSISGKNNGSFPSSGGYNMLEDVDIYEQLTMGQGGDDCTLLGSGNDWLSDAALFELLNGNNCTI
ncbi:fungal specific transcription factor domain-containing protein [Colletotrichum sojae]|uniref:Fungal specific transcription factor domain-containing protein n=1 Tax=Colletotrichum sojae TaxID=2175907 RepID=A0A8H6IYZ0_9PEZI|nr:fungal specific transcription factor domain-containing protein [Colletotrichum sojae]